MPEPSEGESEKDFISRCIPIVLDDGTAQDQEQAAAICYSKWREAKSVTVTPILEESLKVGARHSARDNEALQAIHDGAVTLGAICATKPEITSEPILKDDALVSFGTEVKTLDNGHLAGYLVTFTDETRPDLTGDFFNKSTNFGQMRQTPIYFNHRMPIIGRDGQSYEIKKVIGEGELTIDDVGVFIDAILYSRDEYEKAIRKHAAKMGWSSGTAPHLVDREPKGNANLIKTWPLGLDASITPTPAEPLNTVIPLKSLSAYTSAEPKPNSAPEAATTAAQEVETQAQTNNPIEEEINMTDQVDTKSLIESAVAEAMKAFIAAQPSVNPAGVQVVKDESDKSFEQPGDFFKAVKNAGLPNPTYDPRLNSMKAPTGLNEGVPSQGGFLVPPQIAAGILQKMNSVGSLLSLFPRDPVSGNSMTWNVVDETSRATGSRMGGVTGYWLNEAGSKTSSKPKFRQLELKLKKIAALCYATDEVLEDASALGAWLTREVPNELRFMVEDSIINGDGVGKPEGILGSAALKSATRTDASEIDALDIGRMWAGRYAGANDYVWLVNPTVFPQLLNMVIGQIPVYVGAGGVSGLPYGTILGRPVIETEYNPSLGTLGDILLISPSQYLMIEKAGGIQSASSIHVNFIYDETAFRFVYRVDGAPLWYTTLTGKDTNTYSPYVALAATT